MDLLALQGLSLQQGLSSLSTQGAADSRKASDEGWHVLNSESGGSSGGQGAGGSAGANITLQALTAEVQALKLQVQQQAVGMARLRDEQAAVCDAAVTTTLRMQAAAWRTLVPLGRSRDDHLSWFDDANAASSVASLLNVPQSDITGACRRHVRNGRDMVDVFFHDAGAANSAFHASRAQLARQGLSLQFTRTLMGVKARALLAALQPTMQAAPAASILRAVRIVVQVSGY
jgi:hypothetical protein